MITFEQIEKAFESRPKNLRSAMDSIEYDSILKELSQKYSIHIDALGKIQAQVIYVMLGLSEPANFGKDVADATGLSKETINPLVTDINAQIFLPIRKRMMELDEYDQIIAEPEEKKVGQGTQSVESSKSTESPTTASQLETSPLEIAAPVNIIQEKLQAPQTIAPAVTSHDLPPVKSEPYKGTDPYRELPQDKI